MKKVLFSLIILCCSFFSFAVGTITGVFSVCVSGATTLSCTPGGGTWSSSMPSIATVGATSGTVTGVTAGVVTITYTDVSGSAYQSVTVNPNPGPIIMLTTTAGLCVGSSSTASCSPGGGVWSSSNPSVVSIGSTSGVVTGVSAGSCSISYTLPTGCYSSRVVSINPSPSPITGPSTVCVASTITLSSTPGGGTWSSGSTAIATVGAGTGIVTGVSAGVAIITYAISTCRTTKIVTVTSAPGAIAGPTAVCVGGSATLTNSVPGGSWSSGMPSVATIGAGTGLLTGVSVGTTTITYSISSGCSVTGTVSVVSTPGPITGPANVCTGSSITLACAGGGTWSSSTTSVATVGSSSGVVTGVSAGAATITYTLPGGCVSTTMITVNTAPVITGGGTICAGATITLASTVGGTWSTTSTSVATVGSGTGIVTGVSAGTGVITFASTSGCSSTTVVTVNALPAAITGAASVCVGLTIALVSATPGGTWSSGSTTIATVGSSTGVVAGVAAGTATITYTNAAGCFTTTVVTVTPTPCSTVGVPAAVEQAVTVHPNPAYDELIITAQAYHSYTITNGVGQVMMQDKLKNGQTQVDIRSLPQGIYCISIRGVAGSIVKKFVKL